MKRHIVAGLAPVPMVGGLIASAPRAFAGQSHRLAPIGSVKRHPWPPTS